MEELDLSKINQIDMECSIDDDSDFGAAMIHHNEVPHKTGIIIDLSDDDCLNINPARIKSSDIGIDKILTGDIRNEAPEEQNFFNDQEPLTGINEIDMECSVGEDDDFMEAPKVPEQEEIEPELTDATLQEDVFIDQGKVEDDYYEKLKKKHSKTNVKGAYNVHFHFSGNPKADMDDFNAAMTPAFSEAPASVSIATSGESLGEELETPYPKMLDDMLLILGFSLRKDADNICILHDCCEDQDDIECHNLSELQAVLKPYVDDYFILPLQVETGEMFDNSKDWTNWYTDEMAAKYPKYAQDIAYCDMFENHLNDCNLF